MTVYLQYKGGANERVKKQSHTSTLKAPGAQIRKNMVATQCISRGHATLHLAISVRLSVPFFLSCEQISYRVINLN